MNPGKAIQNKINGVKQNFADYKKLDSRDKKTYWKEFLLNNALYILLIVAIIYTYIQNSNFLSAASIVNIISLSAANLPIACGIAGCIVLTGTDLSAGRVVGLTACITASLMQSVTYATKMFPNLPVLPIPLVILIVLLVGGIVGWVNGFFVAKFQLHPFIVTLATQLIVYGLLLMYIMSASVRSGSALQRCGKGKRDLLQCRRRENRHSQLCMAGSFDRCYHVVHLEQDHLR